MINHRTTCFLSSVLSFLALCLEPLPAGEEPSLPPYILKEGISGNLHAVGSDTMLDLMTYWSEAFCAQYPHVTIALDEKGSNTAPPALISGRSQLAPMSRQMKPQEIAAFTSRFGYPPTEIVVAIDGLAVFVHRDNPIRGITLKQLASVFSEPRDPTARATKWSALGVMFPVDGSIKLFGRNALSGTHTFFKQQT